MNLKNEKNIQYIREVIKMFVVKEKQERFLSFIESKKRYEDFLDEVFIDSRNLNPKSLIEILNGENLPEYIFKQFQKLNTHFQKIDERKKAYVISVVQDIDGKFGNLKEILITETGKNLGTIIYCVGTSLAYYENDEGFRYILSSDKPSI